MTVAPASAARSAAANSGDRALPALALIGLLYVLVGTAWMCDDAFITFRTVRNALEGQGLTWNPGERVQAYTHPAWMLLSMTACSLSGECYFSVLGLAACLTFAAVLMLVHRLREQPLLAAAVVLLLCSSAAFVEYAVCGLENPLLFFLLVLFTAHITRPSAEQRLQHTALLFSSIALTRIDAVLIVGPCCVDLWLRRRDRWTAGREALLGMAPLVLWELFSVVYYGTPVPNTAIAKLNVDVPAEQLFGHGAAYIVNSLRTDPITLTATMGCVVLLLRGHERRTNAAVLGILLYVVYLLRIGGDFMSGRFCGALLVFALASAVYTSRLRVVGPVWQSWLVRALLVYAALWPRSPWRVNIDHGAGLGFFDVVLPNGIADERAYYYPTTGFLRVLMLRREIADRKLPLPPFSTALRGSEFARARAPVAELCMVGFFGYFVGPKHIVDRCALTDPFMARVPFKASEGFRPGHYLRGYPEGYLDSVTSGRNLITDPKLAKLYDRVQAVVTGPLFTRTRWHAIWCLNTGGC